MSDANGGDRPPFPENVPAAGTGAPQASHDGAQQPPVATGQPVLASPSTPSAARHPKRFYAIGGAILVAIVGATASAVITPERLDGLFGMFGGGAGAGVPPSSSTTAPPLETKSVSSGDKALSFAIPAEWGARNGNYNVSPDAGAAVITGTQVDSPVEFGEDGAYIAVSKDFATRTGLADLGTADLRDRADDLVGEADWTIDGCTASDEPSREKDGWQLATRYWKDCAQIPDSKLWEMVAIDDEGTTVVTLQVLLSPDASPEVMDTIVDSFTVDPRKLTSRLGGDVVLP